MPEAPDPLVTVVVPAFNAEPTIGETLRSVRDQSYPALDIVVVDDGSSDATVAIVQQHAAEDPRVRLIRQANGGVAAARNRGVREAAGELIAPVDADDLWRPRKIERQVEAVRRGGPKVALVYTWFALIDERGRLLSHGKPGPTVDGPALAEMARCNLPGNGSSPLMRRAAVLEAGGYDESLRARGVQGCEDLQLYLAIAERHDFACVPDFLTGYRFSGGAMSADARRMLGSFDTVMGAFLERRPDLAAACARGRSEMLIWLLLRALRAKRLDVALDMLGEMERHDRALARRFALRVPLNLCRFHLMGPARLALQARRGRPTAFLKPGEAPIHGPH